VLNLISRQTNRGRQKAAAARLTLGLVTAVFQCSAGPSPAQDRLSIAQRLLAAYPSQLARVEGGDLIWTDGTRMPLRTHAAERSRAARLDDPDIADIVFDAYPVLGPLTPPGDGADPGRYRPAAMFDKMYGACGRGEVSARLRGVRWPGPNGPHIIRVTTINGVADRLQEISAEVARLPANVRPQLVPPAGGYNCRPIAGTRQPSAHGWGIAVDIAVSTSDYWRWTGRTSRATAAPWRNRVAPEIVRIFEAHGFIWGGRWTHFDTMHFEYRPELTGPAQTRSP
jgi:hypothetical protein